MAAMYDEIPRIRAERMLDASQAAAFPHLSRDQRARWLRSMGKVSQRAQRAAAHEQGGLTFNGQPIRTREAFKRQLSLAFGADGNGVVSRAQRPHGARFAALGGNGATRPFPAPSGPRPARHPGASLVRPATNGSAD